MGSIQSFYQCKNHKSSQILHTGSLIRSISSGGSKQRAKRPIFGGEIYRVFMKKKKQSCSLQVWEICKWIQHGTSFVSLHLRGFSLLQVCLNRQCQNVSVFGVHHCSSKCNGRGVSRTDAALSANYASEIAL